MNIVLTLPQSDKVDFQLDKPLEGHGAVETIVEGWAEELTRRGHKVRVAVLGAFDEEEVSHLHPYEIAHINDYEKLAKVNGENADVVIANSRPHHLHDSDTSPLRILFMHNPPSPFPDNNVAGGASWPPAGQWNNTRTELITQGTFFDSLHSMRRADVTLACSQWLADRIHGLSGVEVTALYPHISYEFGAVKRPPRKDKPIILYSGRLVWRKGLADLAALAGYGTLPGELWVTDFVNTATPAPDVAAVRALLHAAPNVKLIPPAKTAKDMAALVAQADVALVPSTDEPFGLVAAEALAAGTPVVGYKSGGLPETGTVGLHLVQSGNVFALKQALDLALASGPLSIAERKSTAHHFSVEISTDGLLATIESNLKL